MKAKTLSVLGSALMTSVALVGAAAAQDASAPGFALTGTGGIVGMLMPSFDTGVLGNTAGGQLFGGMIGGNFTTGLGEFGEYDAYFSLNVFGALGMAGSSFSNTFDGPGTVIVSGLTTPGGAATMTLAPDTATDVDVTGVNGANGTIAGAGATINAGFVAPDGPGFILGAYTDDGANEASYGAIADTSGGIFIATGDFLGLTVSTSVDRLVAYVGVDPTVGIAGEVSDSVGVQVYAGPSYRGLFETIKTTITVDIPEVAPSAATLPEFSIVGKDELTGHYLGGVAGGAISFATPSGLVFTLGGEGGIYGVMASWRGQDTYETCCGDFGTPPGGVVGVNSGPSPSLSVTADPLTFNFASATAFALRGNGSVTMAIENNKALTIGGSLEYLSHVAQVDHSGRIIQTGDTSYTWTPGSTTLPTQTFSWGSMVNFGISASITGQF